MGSKTFVSPISIDLGASHTGVFSLFYQSGSRLGSIEKKSGTVYGLEKDSYTLLMNSLSGGSRTSRRHQRRRFDRRQMAKRLFRLVWEKKFGLSWDQDVAQTVGFLLNRRGFSFLAEEYDKEVLARFPEKAWEKIPQGFKDLMPTELRKPGGIGVFFTELTRDEVRCKQAFEVFNTELDRTRNEIEFCKTSVQLAQVGEALLAEGKLPEKEKKKLSLLLSVSSRIVERWREAGVKGLDALSPSGSNYEVAAYLAANLPDVESIISSLPNYRKDLKKAEASVWNFKSKSFKKDKATFDYAEDAGEKERQNVTRFHLQHLVYAVQKMLDELSSGGRYRVRYFEEVADVLAGREHKHCFLQRFCSTLRNGEFSGLSEQTLTNLIGHISNMELKPLRKYFNDKAHHSADYWSEERLGRFVKNWILKEWRVSAAKNPDKGEGKPQDYKVLCRVLRECSGGIVSFWLEHDPVLTIPPYQDNRNRRPPRCQSLILNSRFLDSAYPGWRTWPAALRKPAADHLENLEAAFLTLKSSKGNPYFSDNFSGVRKKDSQKMTMADLDGRIFQFILDRRKDTDRLKLNEIYSRVKKLRQLANQRELSLVEAEEREKQQSRLAATLAESDLPAELKGEPDFSRTDIFQAGSFLHLVCRYYKARQRARDGRLFIHPDYAETANRGYEFRNRFAGDDQLLTYCNRKPRQKRHQTLSDVAGVLQVSRDRLNDVVRRKHRGEDANEAVVSWLKGFRGIQTSCAEAAKAQKDHRGQLRTKLLAGDDNKLNRLQKKCVENSRSLAADLCRETEDVKSKAAGFESVFSFAQLHNIAFADRSGNANTCPVCSLDNSRRMEPGERQEGARAQRLPAIPTRVIDGAVRRMARILGKRIAADRWPWIGPVLKEGARVRVPIITESNRFEFEPGLAKLKGNGKKGWAKDESFERKDARIAAAGQGICPYSGDDVGDHGELDHIVPRASGFGTMNDEANLVLATVHANQRKRNQVYSLADLDRGYKEMLFGTGGDEQIAAWIRETIWDEEYNRFTFGVYNSFINLDADQQKAFRHALFLVGNPLRQRAISAISNRNRAFVNGTQRYFAEVLANELHKKALRIGREKLLEFDCFAVEAYAGTRGDGVKDWRTHYEQMYREELADFVKPEGKKQESYSHLLDAQIAFAITADKHREHGGLKLHIPPYVGLEAFDPDTGELFDDNIFASIWLLPEEMDESVALERRKPDKKQFRHRAFTRDTFYADRYLPVMLRTEGGNVVVKAGFDWQNSAVWKQGQKTREQLERLLPLFSQASHYPPNLVEELAQQETSKIPQEQRLYELLSNTDYFQGQIKSKGYIYLTIDRLALHQFWLENHNTKDGAPFKDKELADLYLLCWKDLGYRTEKRSISKESDLDVVEKADKFKTTFKSQTIVMAFKRDWQRIKKEWQEAKDRGEEFRDFLRLYFLGENRQKHPHQKVRKEFSLPVVSAQGKFMLRRKGWDGRQTFQIVNESKAEGIVNNKPEVMVTPSGGKKKTTLVPWARSKSFVKLKKATYYLETPVDPGQWFLITNQDLYPSSVLEKVWLRMDDITAPSVAVKLARDATEIDPDVILKDALSGGKFNKKKAKKAVGDNPGGPAKSADEVMVEFWNQNVQNLRAGEILTYKGSKGYNKTRLRALSKENAIPVDRLE